MYNLNSVSERWNLAFHDRNEFHQLLVSSAFQRVSLEFLLGFEQHSPLPFAIPFRSSKFKFSTFHVANECILPP